MGAFQSPKEWGPLLTAMVTPMNEDGSVNYDEAERLANFLVDEQKNTGLVIAGTTGESPTLSDKEKAELLSAVLNAVRDKAAVVFGAGTYDTEHSVHMTQAATEMGAHGVMLVSPYYNKPNQDGLYAHFRKVAESTDLPVMIYNIQGRTAVNVQTPTLVRLASDVPNICAVKEASGNLAQVAEVCASVPEGFRVYSGDDILTLPVLSVGGIGVVSVAGHVAGKQIMEMMETFFSSPPPSAGEGQGGGAYAAAQMSKKLVPLINALFITTNPIPVKYAVSLLGFKTTVYRLPMIPPTDEQKKAVKGAMREMNLIPAKAAVSPG
ncbi:MAG: 4-hydroxy-tetrahydrodipicolinate synthase [Armatimonadetes bacterium]|nr:4-hydroxy-tetrahydrodipicolinate synthase [Armatimonadota bacterium]